jgi:hypothetical protein
LLRSGFGRCLGFVFLLAGLDFVIVTVLDGVGSEVA